MKKEVKILNSKKYICENNNLEIINNLLEDGTINLLESGMNTGKTYLAGKLYELKKDYIKVFITPRNSLGEDVKKRFSDKFNIKILFEGDSLHKADLNKIIITSPESFDKVVNLVNSLKNKKLFVIYDEIHIAITDLYRKKLFTVINTKLENGSITLLGLSATPSILTNFIDFNNIIKINVNDKFRQANTVKILQVEEEKLSEFSIAEEIIKIINKNPAIKIAVRLNNKVLIDNIAKLLIEKNISIGIGTSDNKEYVRNIIKNDGKLTADVSFFTSYTEVGIEFKNNINTILLDFEGLNNTTIVPTSIVQNLGRFRNGVKEFRIYIQRNNTSLNPSILEIKNRAKFTINSIIKTSLESNFPVAPYTVLKDGKTTVSEDIEFIIIKETINVYNENLINNAQDLKIQLEKIETLNVNNIEIESYTYEDSLFEIEKSILLLDKKVAKEQKKEIKKEIENTLNKLNENDFINFDFDNNINLLSQDIKKCIKHLKEIGELEEVRRCHQKLLSLNIKKATSKDLFILAVNFKNTNIKLRAIKNNIFRNNNKANNIHYIKRDNVTKSFAIQNHIMSILERETNSTTKQFRLTKKIMNIILEECKYKEITPNKKDKYKKLLNYIELYYTVNKDSKKIYIGNIKSNYKLKNLI